MKNDWSLPLMHDTINTISIIIIIIVMQKKENQKQKPKRKKRKQSKTILWNRLSTVYWCQVSHYYFLDKLIRGPMCSGVDENHEGF